MHDPREKKLAELLISFSVNLKSGEHVLIESFDVPDSITIELIRAARAAGGHAHVALRRNRITRALVEHIDEQALDTWAGYDLDRMKRMDAYLGVRGSGNINEMAGVDDDRMKSYGKRYMKPVHLDERVNNTRWCVLRWPTASMAQLASMSTEAFEDFYFDVCTLDYARMADAAEKLAERMRQTDRVHLKGPGATDLTFSIRDIPVVPCTGEHNIPDGECFTAPVRDSVNGVIEFNTPTIYHGISFENVRLDFKDGRTIDATASQNAERLGPIFDTDDGARHVGEFAIGFNPYILKPMKDILFDEKIAGSIHFTPGQAYEDADNGNRSEIHWDLVLIQRKDHGGGEMYFDDELVRKDGVFTTDDLKPLNPENLKG